MSSPNQAIINSLAHIAEVYKAQGVIHKYKAYRTAMDTIKTLPTKITSVNDVKNLKGIGKSMEQKIQEILTTGHLQQEEDVMADPINAAVKLFTEIHGIGPVLARKLVHEHNLRTLDDLENCTSINLPPQVRLGLKYHEDTKKRIPFDEIEEHLAFIKAVAREEVDKDVTVTCCGSHRRMLPTSGDIDILVTHPVTRTDSTSTYAYLDVLVETLTKKGYIVDSLAHGATKFMGFCKLLAPSSSAASTAIVRRLDIRFIPYDSFFPALLYFTGSDLHNILMRQDALKLGYTINEYGVWKVAQGDHSHHQAASASPTTSPQKVTGPVVKGERVLVFSEEEIFKLLGRPYVEPKDRSA